MSGSGPTCGCHLLPVTCCVVALALSGWAGWGWETDSAGSPTLRETVVPVRLDSGALPNLHRLTPRVYSGGTPQGDAGLKELAALGVRTVISVDGEAPPAATAQRLGLRYVHLPISYDGVPRERIVELLSAVTVYPGPVYIHCHRGLHRGPAAAVAVCRLISNLDAPTAEKLLEDLGTARKYPGLYNSVENVTPVTETELRQHPAAKLPAVAKVPPLVERMVEIESHWEKLSKRLEAATEWDDDLNAGMVLLEEQFVEAARLDKMAPWRAEMEEFASALRNVVTGLPNAVVKPIQQQCAECHRLYRDQPR